MAKNKKAESLIAISLIEQSMRRSQIRPAKSLKHQAKGMIMHDRYLNNDMTRGAKNA